MKKALFTTGTTLAIAFMLFSSQNINAQTIALQAPEPAGNPNTGSSTPWNRACASATYNEYFVTIKWAGSANSDNQFILELSDASGSFASPTVLSTVSDQNSNSEFTTQFALSTDMQGAGYKMRTRSTSPAATSPASDAYAMYYLGFTTNLHISPDGDGSTPGTLEVCGGGNVTLTVDNVPASELNSYQYSWYRSGTPLGTGPSIETSGDGEYWVYIDYGDCTGSANTESNHIIINTGTSSGIAINTPASTALCAGEAAPALEANVQNGSYYYTWYKDGAVIQSEQLGAYTHTIDTNDPSFTGEYTVQIRGAGLCTETSAPVSITNAGAFTVTRTNSDNLVVLPSQTQTLTVTTDASSPTYQWYRNGTPIPGSDSASLEVSQQGTYYVAVTQTGGTCSSTTINSESTTVVSPTEFKLEIDYATEYTECSASSIVLETKVYAVLADSSELDVTDDVGSSFSYQWQKDGSAVPGETSRSISLTSSDENGSYAVEGDYASMTSTSNSLPVQLSSNASLVISSTSTVYCSSDDVITLSTSTDLAGETFNWERDGEVINSTDATLNVTETGTYRLVVRKGACPLISNEIEISPLDPELITLDVDGDVIFPEGSSKTVTASGGTSYRWFDANNNEIATTDSVTFSTEGNYTLVATVGNCDVVKPVTVAYLDLFNIPNVITPNGDGANDQWVIPNSYSNKSDVNVIIYNAKGSEVLNVTNYRNNWPESSTSFTQQNMVFYYVIKNASETLKQGTITVIR
ncbi:T9SS type B sorting domain-containing protein [Pseudozobellia thermophila]|uniref:Gliding motility-associated C-terminal domain-containing protein n=1 Tax=Pseudozobellia thermophila TaxID=192903 RepID=A0A1M6BI36_9FLAO|nr:gliding motility-associated C-terminal domain-containing protein [Pseudozobellia thermophila]SHI48394.1 gliding motility-associated C-terminal domain-containing protein [Pseudozobellia thermophila]